MLDFWLSRGIAGFRVDMAFSLVKDHRGKNAGRVAATQVWRDLHAWMRSAHPDAVLIPEGKEPRTGLGEGFDADFFLVIHAEHASLFDNVGAGTLPFQQSGDAFFHADGLGSTRAFLDGWAAAKADDPARPVLMGTADHDFSRLRTDPRTTEELGAALTFLFTWGTVPSLYYGDEIGMRYVPGLPDVEGSICNPGYNRSGCRTPMQWDDSPNAGFSTAPAEDLYLPIDPSDDRPTVPGRMVPRPYEGCYAALDGTIVTLGFTYYADLVVSEWTITEMSSALSIKTRTGQIRVDERAAVALA